MKTRVHYTDPQGRASYKDLAVGKAEARATFEHLFQGCKAERIEVIGAKKPPQDATAELPLDAPLPPRLAALPSLRALYVQERVASGDHSARLPQATRGITGDGKWFERGKEARLHGELRDKVDGRMTPGNRTAFQAGWDEQERFMQPPSEEQIAQSAAVAARLAEWAKTTL